VKNTNPALIRVYMDLPADTHERFKNMAKQQGQTKKSLLILLIENYVKEHKHGGKKESK